jgi:hypothetical protein
VEAVVVEVDVGEVVAEVDVEEVEELVAPQLLDQMILVGPTHPVSGLL